jgi:hypothetical protein
MPEPDGRIIINGVVTPEALEANKRYAETHTVKTCELCGQTYPDPIRQCICGMYVCDKCYPDHESGG